MSASEALKTIFKGDGPTTQVIIPLVVAEEDHGEPIENDDAFAAWIDENNDRIYAAAVMKRKTETLFETVALALGDLRAEPRAPSFSLEQTSIDPDEEARVVVSGEPVEEADPLFVGRIDDAFDYILTRSTEEREGLQIWTAGRVYGSDDVERVGRSRSARKER